MGRREGPELAAALARAAFPEQGRALVAKLAEADPKAAERVNEDELAARAVVAIADNSRSLARLVLTDPGALAGLTNAALVTEPRRADLVGVAETLTAAESPLDALRRWRNRQFLFVTVRDLLGYADLASTGRALAALGDACLAASLRLAAPQVPLAVLGMGKLGGDELNYASDVDVIFVHDGRGATDGDEARRACRALIQAMTEVRVGGILFRTDVDLRPEGPQGLLSRTPESYEAYFRRWAQPWERQAYLKTRYVAGDPEVSNRLFDVVRAFVWDQTLDSEAVGHLRRIKGRSEDLRGAPNDIKRGPGGIRDIEFSVQLLQLVHGRQDRALRSSTTLDAIDQLVRAGLVDHRDAATLHDAYIHLRTVEHRLQLRDERQTHSLPESPEDQRWLARVLGYRDQGVRSASQQFAEVHRAHRSAVRQVHESLYYRPILEAIAGVSIDPALFNERLAALGFADPDQVVGVVERLTAGLSRSARAMRQLLPIVLDELAASPDPDLGLVRLGWITDGPTRSGVIIAAIRDSPAAVGRLCCLLGSSKVVADSMRRHPDLVGDLVHARDIEDARDPEALLAGAAGALALRVDEDAADDELRRFTRRELLRVAVRDLLGFADGEAVGHELSAIADAAVAAVLGTMSPPAPFGIIAMGRYGGGELGYASDLDVVFAYGGKGPDVSEQSVRTAQRILRRMGARTSEGRVWEIDARLRPDGEKGLMARSIDGYRRYYSERAKLWERQALIKARPGAGDADVGRQFVALVDAAVYRPELSAEEAAEIRAMKLRIEKERADHRTRARDVKLGPGGLTDVEFCTQLLQLRHGYEHAPVRTPNTLAALAGLAAVGVLDPDDAAALAAASTFAQRVRNRAHLQSGQVADVIPSDPIELRTLGRSLGYRDRPGDSLLAEHQATFTAARAVVDRLFYDI